MGEQRSSCPQIQRSFEEWQVLTRGRRPHPWAKRHEVKEERLKLRGAQCGLETSSEQVAW